jgi:hypothetical protein
MVCLGNVTNNIYSKVPRYYGQTLNRAVVGWEEHVLFSKWKIHSGAINSRELKANAGKLRLLHSTDVVTFKASVVRHDRVGDQVLKGLQAQNLAQVNKPWKLYVCIETQGCN